LGSSFKSRINKEEVIEIIGQHPVYQWLELFAKIESFLIIKNERIKYPQAYLAQRLFSGSVLRRISDYSLNKAFFFSFGQLNILRKLVIVYGNNVLGDEIPIPLVSISKALLAAQDFHNEYDENAHRPEDFENFCQFVIRNGYLNSIPDAPNLFVRTYQMYVLLAQNLPFDANKDFGSFFKEKVGITVEQTISLSFALANPFFQHEGQVFNQTTIINPETFFKHLQIDQAAIETIVGSLTISFSEVKEMISKELVGIEIGTIPAGYNLDIFRKTPLIRFDNGKLVCANLSSLLQKATQNIIWLPKNQAKNLTKRETEKLVNDLTSFRGQLFGEYIKDLCNIMQSKNRKLSYLYIPAEATQDHEEVGDSILVQGDSMIVFEAKSRQFNELFKYTGDWEHDMNFIEELIRKAVEQIERAVNKIREGGVDKFSLKQDVIKKVYPVIVTYEPIPMHAKMQRFIRQRVRELGLLTNSVFSPLEIISVNDLEEVIDCVDSYTIIDLLQDKHSLSDPHKNEANFNNFFSSFTEHNTVMSNGWQRWRWDQFTEKVFKENFIFKK